MLSGCFKYITNFYSHNLLILVEIGRGLPVESDISGQLIPCPKVRLPGVRFSMRVIIR